jgi:hypothetical protein
VAQLGVVQAAGHFLAVTGDEGHGGAFVQQAHGRFDLLWAYAQFLGDAAVDAVHKPPEICETAGRSPERCRRRWMKARRTIVHAACGDAPWARKWRRGKIC